MVTRRSLLSAAASAAAMYALPATATSIPSEASLLDDASRLNATPVFRHRIAAPTEHAFVSLLRQELREAAAAGRPFAVAAARHSLGGQSLPRHGTAITLALRFVEADRTSLLAYAPSRRIAAVLSFSQEMTPEAETDMRGLTEELIENVIALGGSFYLPYRLHARRDQLERAYPHLETFVARKLHYDPARTFRNALWDTYLG
jgi:FAD/FMN-containing dehydrogenase